MEGGCSTQNETSVLKEVFIICSRFESNGTKKQGWFSANLDISTGILSDVVLRTPDLLSLENRSEITAADCYILMKTPHVYHSSTSKSDREGYIFSAFSSIGKSITLGDWADVSEAISVIGLRSFTSLLSISLTVTGDREEGGDAFFVSCGGNLIWQGYRNYYVSYFPGTKAPSFYLMNAPPITDGENAIVLGSWTNTLPILAKISVNYDDIRHAMKILSDPLSSQPMLNWNTVEILDTSPSVLPNSSVRSIPWSHIYFDSAHNNMLGRGACGVVYQAHWRPKAPSTLGRVPVAIKVVTKSAAFFQGRVYEEECARTKQEAERIVEISHRGGQALHDLIVQVYGFVEGTLPESISSSFHLHKDEEAFGVVMRLEAGGSLEKLLYPAAEVAPVYMSMFENVRVLSQIIRGIAELHAVGVVHGDLKPANILLTNKNPPDVRIADFGLSELREVSENAMLQSTMRMTKGGIKGTPVYCAPEMLCSAGDDSEGDTEEEVVKASRSTDMYAFAIIAHEFLSRERPFESVKNPTKLWQKLNRGIRPSLSKLPMETPPAIIGVIQSCWDSDRSNRTSAIEAMAVLEHDLWLFESKTYDIFFSHCWAMKPFLSHLYNILVKMGYRVWYDQNDMGYDLSASMREGILQSKVVLACVDSCYQSRPNCMFELNYAKDLTDPSKPVVTVLTEGNVFEWGNKELLRLCEVSTKMYVDLGDVAAQAGWSSAQGPTHEMIKELITATEPLIKILHNLNCRPSIGNHVVAARRY